MYILCINSYYVIHRSEWDHGICRNKDLNVKSKLFNMSVKKCKSRICLTTNKL